MRLSLSKVRFGLASAGVLLTIAVASSVAAQVSTPQPGMAPPTQWPAFTMVWLETAAGLGRNGAVGTQRLRLEYTDQRHFRITLLDHSEEPGAGGQKQGIVGTTWTVDGTRSIYKRRETARSVYRRTSRDS